MALFKFIQLIVLFTVNTVTNGEVIIDDLPIVGNIKEATNNQTAIVDVKCRSSTSSSVDVSIVSITSTPTPLHCQSCFHAYDLQPIPSAQQVWKIYFTSGSSPLTYLTARRYDVRVRCRDGNNATIETVVEINVVPNTPPFYDQVFITVHVNNSRDMLAGESLGVYEATDTDGDILSYTMSTSISTDHFLINTGTGEIILNKALGSFCRSYVILYIKARDNIINEPAILNLQLHFNEMNYASVISGFNRRFSVDENSAPVIIPVVTQDDFQLDFTCILISNPSFMAAKIFYNTTGEAIVVSTLNYELDHNVNISIQCSDGQCPSESKWLYIQIEDANDAPTLGPSTQTISVPEGYISVIPDFLLHDEDNADSSLFYFVGVVPTGFAIDKFTGRLRTTFDFRVDKKNESYIDLTIAANDTKGEQPTNTIHVILRVYDINDHRPVATNQSREFQVEECTDLGQLGQLQASDKDGGSNGEIEFEEGVSGSLSVTSTGEILLLFPPVVGRLDHVEVYVWDKGDQPGVLKSAGPVSIALIVTPCRTTPVTPVTSVTSVTSHHSMTTTPTLTPRPDRRKKNYGNVPWIWSVFVLGLIILAVVIFIIYRCHKTARSRHRNMTPKTNMRTGNAYDNYSSPEEMKLRSNSTLSETPGASAQTQSTFFHNDSRNNYVETYTKSDMPSFVL